jgi:ABC-2 type transport system permease protein
MVGSEKPLSSAIGRSLTRLSAILHKEALEYLRDKRTIVLMIVSAFLLPALGVLSTGLRTQQLASVTVAVCDEGTYANTLVGLIESSIRRRLPNAVINTARDCGEGYDAGSDLIVVIPSGFSANLTQIGLRATILVYRAVGSVASEEALLAVKEAVYQLSRIVTQERIEELVKRAGAETSVESVMEPLILKEVSVTPEGIPAAPELEARAYISRFLAFSIFFLLNPAAIAVADSIAREREAGTGELLSIAPLRPWELIVGKAIGSLTAALIAGAIDVVAVGAYLKLAVAYVGTGIVAFHALHVILSVIVTAAMVMVLTLLIPGRRAGAVITSLVTGTAILAFFSALFVDVERLPTVLRIVLYLIPYTHSAAALLKLSLGRGMEALIHTLTLVAVSALAMLAATAIYTPERMARRY